MSEEKVYKNGDDFYKEYPMYERKPIEDKPVLKLTEWGLFETKGYQMGFGRMATQGHPYIRQGQYVEHTSIVINKFVNEEGNIVLETHNSLYELIGKSLKELLADADI